MLIKRNLCSQKASKKGKYGWGKKKRVFHLRRLFNLGSEDILNLSERKRGGVGFVEIENERKMSKLN